MNLNFLLSSVVWSTAFEASPAGGDSPALGDDRIREVKSAVSERLIKEHKMDLSSGAAASDGWHRQGSAIDYYQASAPTTRPDGVTALDASDYGRKWYCPTTGVEAVYTASGWVNISALSAQVPTIVTITSGSGNWTVPAGVSRIRVTCVGGGGGSGGFAAGQTSGGGGGGGAAIKTFTTSPGASLAYVVGSGGAGGAIGGGNGGDGGDTTFTVDSVTLIGGHGHGGKYGVVGQGDGGSGGAGTAGDINISGGRGGDGYATTDWALGGAGGASLWACFMAGRIAQTGIVISGANGVNYGGGASGGAQVTGWSGNRAGAAGAAGIIIIEY